MESFAYSMLLGGAEFRRWLPAWWPPAPPMVQDPALIDRDANDMLRVTLNRPQRRNAYGRQLRDALTDALRVALLDPSLERVVLDGAGPCFCSGGDLAEFGTAPDLVTAHFVRTLAGAGGWCTRCVFGWGSKWRCTFTGRVRARAWKFRRSRAG